MTTEQNGPMPLAKIDPVQSLARQHEVAATRQLEPTNIEEAFRVAEMLFESGLCPRALKSPAAVFAVMMAGRELGMPSMQSMRAIDFFEGKVSLKSDTIAALVLRSPECEMFHPVDLASDHCTYEAKRRGQPAARLTWSMDDAKAAGLLGKDNWKKYPRAMLRARCIAELARAVFPDVALGMYDPDEVGPSVPQRIPDMQVVPTPAGSDPGLESAPVEIDVESILARLAECQTLDSVTALSRECKGVPHGPARESLAAAFKARREALQAATAAA